MRYFLLYVSFLISFGTVAQVGNSAEGEVFRATYSYPLEDFVFIDYQELQITKESFLQENNPLIEIKAILLSYLDTVFVDHEVRFTYNSKTIRIIKYWGSTKKNARILTLRKGNGKWVLAYISELSDIIYAIHRLKTESFWLFYNRNESNYTRINEIRNQVRTKSGILNLMTLGRLIKINSKELTEFCDSIE